MSKFRLIYYIFSLFAVITIVILSYNSDYFFIFGLLSILIISPNFILKQNEHNALLQITLEYAQTCDPKEYLENLINYNKGKLKNKKMKIFDELTYSQIYLDMGEFTKAFDILQKYSEVEVNFSNYLRFWYFHALSNYFILNNKLEKAKLFVNEIEEISKTAPVVFKNSIYFDYKILSAKIDIRNNISLESIKSLFEEILKDSNLSPLKIFSYTFYLGIINLKLGNKYEGVKQLQTVSNFNDNLYYARLSKKILLDINNLPQ